MTSYPLPPHMAAAADHPAAFELLAIRRLMAELADRIADFVGEHTADGHTCPTCDYLARNDGYPDTWDHLSAARHALWASGSFVDNDRPFLAAEWDSEMRDLLATRRGEVEPDTVVDA